MKKDEVDSMSRTKKIYQCDYCKEEFKRPPSRINGEHHFCSYECRGKWQVGEKNNNWSKKIEKECQICGKKFKVKPSRKDTVKFCSKECKHKWMSKNFSGKDNPYYSSKIKIECEECGKKVLKMPYEVEQAKHHFCSMKCSHKWRSDKFSGENHPGWKGGREPYYGPNWKRQQKKARKRDNHTCQKCGKTNKELGRELDVHHKTPLRKFKGKDGNINFEEANKFSNLISLCQKCHMKVEHNQLVSMPPLS